MAGVAKRLMYVSIGLEVTIRLARERHDRRPLRDLFGICDQVIESHERTIRGENEGKKRVGAGQVGAPEGCQSLGRRNEEPQQWKLGSGTKQRSG